MFDHYRDLRHTDSYSVSFYAAKEECEGALGTAKEFLDALNKLLDAIKQQS